MEFKRFEVTKDHIKLLKRMWVSWNDDENGSPTVDCKRPYGNSDVDGDIVEILGWAARTGNISQILSDKAWGIHKEMETVLQICVSNNGVKPGIYETTEEYDNTSWRFKCKKSRTSKSKRS